MQGWMLGDFSKIVQGNYEIVLLIFPAVVLSYLFAHRFTLMGMGEDIAKSLGLGWHGTVALSLLIVSATVSVTVITIGTISFVGLIVPNLVALWKGDNLAKTLPVVGIGGAVLLLSCDLIGRLVIWPYEVPIGLTAGSIGGMIFLGLILRRMA
jgi:iron complex transport system permease protein